MVVAPRHVPVAFLTLVCPSTEYFGFRQALGDQGFLRLLLPARDTKKGESSRRAGTNEGAVQMLRERLLALRQAARSNLVGRQRIMERPEFQFPKGFYWTDPEPEPEGIMSKLHVFVVLPPSQASDCVLS